MFRQLKDWARRVKRDAVTLWFAYRDPATPWAPRALCWFVVAYALSPIDLIPDFIPVLGYVDDVLLLPALIWLALRMLPPEVVGRSRQQAETWLAEQRAKPRSLAGAWLIGLVWLGCALAGGMWLWRRFGT